MKGENLFEAHGMSKRASAPGGPCVFISYSRRDKEVGRATANHIRDCGVNIYFDEHDQALQLADEQNDHRAVVRCIEDGLENCSHLLGIITENTRDSWWVPYEIGGASGRNRECAHLIHCEVGNLPSYIQAADVLLDNSSLLAWLPSRAKDSTTVLLEALSKLGAAASPPSFLPSKRDPAEIKFYSTS